MNGDGKNILTLNTRVQILWDGNKYINNYMPNNESISVNHGESWYNFILQ